MNDNRDLDKAQRMLAQAGRALRHRDRTQARRLAFIATQLDPNDERPWMILGALAAPRASLFYLNRALELNPQSEVAQQGLAWATERLRRAVEAPRIPAKSMPEPAEVKLETHPASSPGVETIGPSQRIHPSAFSRVAKYTSVRGIALFASVLASIFLIVYIANLGGYLDTIQRGLISEDISGMLMGGWLKDTPVASRPAIIEQTRLSMEASYGLDQPYILRTINWLYRGITFDWGRSRLSYAVSNRTSSNDIRTLILTYLPRTLLLLGSANVGLFLVSILIALRLVSRPSRWANRLVMWLAPTSSIPGWLIGLILLSSVYKLLGNYSFRLGYNEWTGTFDIQYIPAILQGLSLPFLAIVLSKLFQCVYSWRNYFLVDSREDYVELAKAKGLPDKLLERRYLLRPVLPSILTSFALILISIWQECIAIEYFFNIDGVGGLFMRALNSNDIAVIVALVAAFAYFLAITVFVLDIVYALIDPRVRIGNEGQNEKPVRGSRRSGFSFNPFGERRHPALPDSPPPHGVRVSLSVRVESWLTRHFASARQTLIGTGHSLSDAAKEIARYPAAVAGVAIVVVLALISVCTVIAIPYNKAVSLWRGDDKAWIRNPRQAPPVWTNFFREEKLPENIDLSSKDHMIEKVVTARSDGTTNLSITFPFDFSYAGYPQDILILFHPSFKTKQPFVSITLVTPDAREFPIGHFAVGQDISYFFSQDQRLVAALNANSPVGALFTKPAAPPGEILKGKYQLKVDGILFEEQSDLDAEVVVYGQVYGIAGTDSLRRDLSLILKWGLAVALSFGILAAVGTTISSVTLAAAGAWFGGWVDGLIQRISEINMVLPMLPTCIMIFFLYSKSFWVILGVTVGLSIFGNSIKNYRAMFLQAVELPYIEAAAAYGASGWRIIFHYMIPRIRNVLIPQLVILVPSYVFFETTLTFLGVTDPFLPTLGKLLYMIMEAGVFNLPVYIWMEAAAVLLLLSIGFALLGFGLERAYQDRAGI